MRFASLAVRVCALFLLSAALIAQPAWGQAGSSTIRGTVTDPQKAVVPGATVTLTNLGTNLTRSQVTTAAGTFSFELIPPGTYRVEIKAQGFRTKVLNNVQALVGSAIEASTQLEVGSVSETVQVEASSAAVTVNTQDATLGNNFVSQQILELPMESRNVQALLTLQPGVTRQGYVAGARSDQSNITLDGVDINEAQSNSLGSPVLRLNSEAIEEFRVTTVNANANQGRSSAAQINLITKSGTNEIRGSAFWYHRSTGFTANNFFNNRAVSASTPNGIPRPALIRNLFGGTIGGPVIKDKLFFFYSYEGRTDASAASVVRTVPLAHMGQGSMRYRDTNGVVQTLTLAQMNAAFPQVQMNPVAIAALQAAITAYPSNDNTSGDLLNTGGFRFNAPTPRDLNSNVGKIDWTINDKQTLFIRANFIYDLQGQVPAFPDTPAPNLWEHPWGGVVSHNWTFGANWVNNFRYGYTRQAFSDQGDSSDNSISFRFVFSPRLFSRTLSRTTPVHNIVNDTSWIKNNHTIQFGTNMRIIRNGRTTFANAFDTAITNPSFYNLSGTVVSDAVSAYLAAQGLPALNSVSEAQNAATALIGRFSQYSARFTFDLDGSLLPSGSASNRIFATEEYDWYVQDSWRLRRNLTINYGLRYSISRPVYETQGFEVKPDVPLQEYFRRRLDAAAKGVIFADPLTLDLSGPANGRSPMYTWDRNNLQPRVAVAWSPDFKNPFLTWLFGAQGRSVFRGGFSITNDYYGQALAVLFDLNNTLGFTSNFTTSANTFDISTARNKPLAPLFTGYGQAVRPLPFITVPSGVSFPRTQPSDFRRRIEGGLDEGLVAPINYVWNFTIERELPHGFVVQANYTGRLGRNLLATRDVMALSNLVDPSSGMDWYTAATILEKIRATRPPGSTQVQTISYFENIFNPSVMGDTLANLLNGYYGCNCVPTNFNSTQAIFWVARNFNGNDWTFTQDDIEGATGIPFFFNPQYGALSAWGTIGNSNYHGGSLSIRQRYRGLLWDLNYTFAHSLDDSSGLQNSTAFGGGFILNPIRQRDNYATSDFDVTHQVNINAVYDLPFGRGKHFGGGVNRGADAIIGGWQLSGIFRWNTGLPFSAPYDNARWATNWNVQSNVTPVDAISPCITKGDTNTSPKLFGCNNRVAYQTFRNAYPGETGPRNIFRLPGFVNLDLGLSKSFTMPYNERHKLQLRWEVFNVTNTQRFGTVDTSRTGYGIGLDNRIRNLAPPANWSNFTGIQGSPRVMQIGARFEF